MYTDRQTKWFDFPSNNCFVFAQLWSMIINPIEIAQSIDFSLHFSFRFSSFQSMYTNNGYFQVYLDIHNVIMIIAKYGKSADSWCLGQFPLHYFTKTYAMEEKWRERERQGKKPANKMLSLFTCHLAAFRFHHSRPHTTDRETKHFDNHLSSG